MNKKILISLSVIGVVAAIVIGGTAAYFSDTETSKDNLFVAGTIDIFVDGDNFDWEGHATLEDMKPCYTDYINFTIYNNLSDPNPVNVWKHLIITYEEDGATSEPECTEQGGEWIKGDPGQCYWNGHVNNNNISSIIDYDLIVEVYDSCGRLIWWQTIYDKEVTVAEIACKEIYLGMIPVDGYMKVIQSYHMQDPNFSTNWAQGDIMAFDLEITGIQLRGEAWLDFKQATKSPEEYWKVQNPGNPAGTLTYIVKHPEFDYDFNASGLQTDTEYSLIYYADPWPGNNPGALLGTATTDGSGNIAMSSSVELNMNLPGPGDLNHPDGAKVWLVPSSDYDAGTNELTYWNPGNYLFEIGLIYYYDTDF
ncbi:SipW-dependent-type signal peptide-containing protein [Candidatus Parcubacteria bacterium]|nr:SipW-dependent-type signal peptide-containing protein [Candidatus Parcubacteria bacterium]